MTQTNTPPDENSLPKWQVNLIGFYYVVLVILLGFLVYELWPQYNNENQYIKETKFFWCMISLSLEQRIILLVIITGAIGSFIHAAGSFTNFVGEKKLEKTWGWWYALRPFIGMAVAFVFYLVFRGGLLTNTQAGDLNIYGILTLSALAGLFNDKATLKLKEVFDALFQPKDERSGKLKEDNSQDAGNEPKG